MSEGKRGWFFGWEGFWVRVNVVGFLGVRFCWVGGFLSRGLSGCEVFGIGGFLGYGVLKEGGCPC